MTLSDKPLLSQKELAQAIMSGPLYEGINGHTFDEHYWLDVAQELGPDYCQALYHAAVFNTKVAS